MKKIYVLDENNNLQLIDAGVTQYNELTGVPISTETLNTTVAADGTLSPSEGHAWSETEVINFCAAAADGRYDLLTAEQGHEILLVDSTNQLLGRRYRRINTDYDVVWDSETSQWITISDTSAKQLIYKFLNESEIPSTVVVGDPFIIQLYYYSNVGTGRVTVTMNGVAFTVGTVASGQQIDIDLTSRIVDGSNTISVKIANDATQAFVPELTVTGINLTYTPDFDQYNAFTGDVIFNYSCSGSSNKVIHFDIINADGETSSYEVSHGSGYYGAYATLSQSYFSKGENTIKTYMYAIDSHGSEVTRTITTTYKIPFLTDDEPLLMVYYDAWDNLKQYGSISIPYYIWSMSAGNVDKVDFSIVSEAIPGGSIDYEYTTQDSGALVNYLQYNARHNWMISSLPTTFVNMEDKEASFVMYGTYDTDTSTNVFIKEGVSIESSSSAMQTVEGYKFNFAATDLIRAVDTWTSTGTDPKQMTLSGFNWNTDGIATDDDGNSCLRFSPAASSILDEPTNPLFGAYNQRFTLELNFRVAANASENPIIKYYDPDAANPNLYGLFIYPNKAVFNYTGGSSEINYFAGERTHLAYVICNKTVTDANPATPDQPQTAELLYLFVYVNGILSQMKPINSSTVFPYQCGTIEFNTNQNNFDLYSFRGYAFALTSAQVMQNFVSEIGNATNKEIIYLKNNVYDETELTGVPGEYEVSFDKVKGKIPCYIMVAETLPDTKAYVPGRGIYYEKEGSENLTQWSGGKSMATTYYYTRDYKYVEDPEGQYIKVDGKYIIPESYEPGVTRYSRNGFTNWIRSKNITFGGQGTSSLAYPRKNFKLKHKDKFYIKGHTSGKEKNFTFKADYMDSSGANNIGNAQVMDDSVIRTKWIGTPVATNPNLRINLDGFPIAMFWCPAKANMTEGVEQDAQADNVYDSDKVTQLFDAVRPSADNELIGEVVPKDPQYIGTFNFNYDKKAKALLGWDSKLFQGFEFRGNSSNCDLFRGFENMCALCSTSEGYEWRWTTISDWIDDYHDGNLALTIDGGYFTEDVDQKYDEAAYLADGGDSIVKVPAFNYFYIKDNGVNCELYHAVEDPETHEVTYTPINYISINPTNSSWDITSCEGISKLSSNICLEYGVKNATKNDVDSFCYQLPYHVSENKPLGEAYPDGSHYYAFSFNSDHEFKYEYNTDQEYFTDIDNWTALYPLSEVKARKVTYTQDDDGLYYYDNSVVKDKDYHLIANYPAEKQAAILADTSNRYTQTEEWLSVTTSDYVYTWDYMREIFKNWAYVIEAVSHSTSDNYKAILDSRNSYGNNGNGLFCYDALLNYFCSSLVSGLCDNYAKNMFMHSYDGGKTWSPAWYDMD